MGLVQKEQLVFEVHGSEVVLEAQVRAAQR
jgi:hypothetical protein